MVQILICLLTRAYGTQRQISNYYCSLPCKVDSFRMKVKKYLGLRISRYPHSTSTFQLSCLTISGDICPNPGPSGKPNSPQAIAGLNVLYFLVFVINPFDLCLADCRVDTELYTVLTFISLILFSHCYIIM